MPALIAALLILAASDVSPWVGVWTWDACHEDRMPGHDKDTYCREGRDRIIIALDPAGAWEITKCPTDSWGERGVKSLDGGRTLTLRTPEGFDVRLVLGEDRAHFRGQFRGSGGHSGRIWGRRVAGCG